MQIFVKDKNFYMKTIRIALPVTLQGMISISVNLLDTIMLGSFGEAQLSASSLANQFFMVFHILCMGVGGGAAVITAQYWGSQNIDGLKKIVTIMMRIILAISAVFLFATLFFPSQIMSIYTNESILIEKGGLYFKYLLYTYPLLGLSQTVTIVLRSVGVVKIPLFSSLGSFFINVFFNWVFIFGKLGAPAMEIEGAALGTLIARLFEMAFVCGYLLFFDKKIKYRVRDFFCKCHDYVKEYMKYSTPVIISDLLLALGNSAIAIVVGRLGSNFVSANAITTMTVQLTTVFNQGLGNASGIITGNTLGQGDKEKAYHQGVTFFAMSALVGIASALVVYLINPMIISFYNITADTIIIAKELMDAVAFNVVFACVSMVMTKGVLRGGGDTKFLMMADILFLWVASVPLGILAAFVFNASPFIIYTALKIDMIIKTFWCLHRLNSKKWIKKI